LDLKRKKDRQNMSIPDIDIASMEPKLPEEANRDLEDIAFTLIASASSLAGQVNPIVTRSIGELVRLMNCYYSNLIEGHDTHPRDIDRALRKDLSRQPKQRQLQLEAVAHIEVQKAIDEGSDDRSEPLTSAYGLWLHREFCKRLPDAMLWVEDPHTHHRVRVEPGVLRDGQVEVGNHLPPAATALPKFLARFDEAYDPKRLSKLRQILAIAAAHHRFLWIHPFFDGNGRVARLMSHAMLTRIGIGSSLWSVARGLARSVGEYKGLLTEADQPRRTDLDGRGALSQRALIAFCRFFLERCVDQVSYMRSILEPSELVRRIEIYTEDEVRAERLPKGAFPLLREALLSGEFERGKADSITGYGERTARTTLSSLIERGLLISDSPKTPVRLGFPLEIVERWFPALYPATRR
jgi:Fic family protein